MTPAEMVGSGPLVLVSDANEERAKTLLREAGYIG